MNTFEVPYGAKLWPTLTVAILMCASTVITFFVATLDPSSDPSSTPIIRAFIWVIFSLSIIPTAACLATLLLIPFVKNTLKLTSSEISAPRFGFSLHSTHVLLSTVTKVSLGTLRNGRRYLNIYYKGGRLGISESFMPSADAFNKVLAAFGDTPGANSSFKVADSAAAYNA